MKIQINYNANNITPNDGHEYDEAALAGEFKIRFEQRAEKLIEAEYPQAEIEFDWTSSRLRVYVTSDPNDDIESESTVERRVEEMLTADNDVWEGIQWEQFLAVAQ